MKKIILIATGLVFLNSCTNETDSLDSVNVNEIVNVSVEGKNYPISFTANEVVKNEYYLTLSDFIKNNPLYKYNFITESGDVVLKKEAPYNNTTNLSSKAVVGLDCSGWYKLYDANWNLIVEHTLNKDVIIDEDLGLLYNDNIKLKDVRYIQAKNVLLYVSGAKYQGFPRSKWSPDVGVGSFYDARGTIVRNFTIRTTTAPTIFQFGSAYKPAVSGAIWGVKGTFNCEVIEN